MLLDALSIFALVSFLALAAIMESGGTVHRRVAIIGALVAVGNALFSVRHVSFLALAVMETFGTLLGLLRLGRALEALLLLDAPIIIGDVSVLASTVVEILGAAPLSLLLNREPLYCLMPVDSVPCWQTLCFANNQ